MNEAGMVERWISRRRKTEMLTVLKVKSFFDDWRYCKEIDRSDDQQFSHRRVAIPKRRIQTS